MTTDKALDRRPIKAREAAFSKHLTTRMVRMGVTPDSISVAGMLAGIAAGLALAATRYESWSGLWFLLAATGVQLRLMANMFDGMVAIESGRVSPLGPLYNEVPDRVSDAATLVGCGYALGGNLTLGYWATILAIFLAYLRAQGGVAGAPQIYDGPMAKQHRMFVVTVACVISAVLPVSWWPEWPGSIANPVADSVAGPMAIALVVIIIGEVVTALRRLVKISSALRSGCR